MTEHHSKIKIGFSSWIYVVYFYKNINHFVIISVWIASGVFSKVVKFICNVYFIIHLWLFYIFGACEINLIDRNLLQIYIEIDLF